MRPSVSRWYRTLRFGAPIVVVSGLPRSGTSMTMSMLEAGGLEIVSDGIRVADVSNPRGYHEYERVRTLASDPDAPWLEGARGKAIKIISFLLRHLPETNNYRVLFMHRNMDEVMASQREMLGALGEPVDVAADARLALGYEEHLSGVGTLLSRRPCFEVLNLEYRDVLDRPAEQAERIARFLRAGLDVSRMADAVDRTLPRHRR